MVDELKLARGIILALPDAAILLNRDLEIIDYNPPYLSLVAVKRRVFEAAPPRIESFLKLDDESRHELESFAAQCLKTGRATRLAEMTVANINGESRTIFISFLPIKSETDECAGVIAQFRDVSDDARIQSRYKEMLAQERARADELGRQVEERTKELRGALEEVTRLSRVDPLTKILNRRAFADYANAALDLCKRHDRFAALLLCDLDRFKRLNDTYGHAAGDAALVAFSEGLGRCFRNTDKIARFGGEEFVILLTETNVTAVPMVADRCNQMARDLPMSELVKGFKGQLSVSIGIAHFPEHGSTLDDLLLAADAALYHAKDSGRDRYIVFDEALGQGTEAGPGPTSLNVLIVDSDRERRERYMAPLADSCEIYACGLESEAIDHCKRGPIDVIVTDRTLDDALGAELLWKSIRLAPDALRVLLIENRDLFLKSNAAQLAQVDVFLLREDAVDHLHGAIEDGLDRRRLSSNPEASGGSRTQRAYLSHVSELETLIQTRDVFFHYQPIVRAVDKSLLGYEALCRNNHPIFRDPTVLFEAAIQSGNILQLSRLVRGTATDPLSAMADDTLLFVNLHPAEFSDPQLVFGSPLTERVVFEITERSAIPDGTRFYDTIRELRARGYRIAVDDLGAGYASLNSVALLQPDFIKIDMALVRNIDRSTSRSRLVTRIVEFANDEGIQVIAEGIETHAEMTALEQMGCHLLQGYYFGRPAPLPGPDASATPPALPPSEPER